METVASRTVDTPDGPVQIVILCVNGSHHAPDEDSEYAEFVYEVWTPDEKLFARQRIFGADSMQALLLCIAGCGDLLSRYYPVASCHGSDGHGLLQTDLSNGLEWRATVRMTLE